MNALLFITWLAGLNAYSGHVKERIRAGDATGSGVKIQFKSPVGKNLSYENPLDKNVSHVKKFTFLAH